MVWKSWLRSLVMREAKQRLASGSLDTVTSELKAATSLEAAVDVALIVNESAEAGSMLDRMTGVLKIHSQECRLYRGLCEGRHVLVAQVSGDAARASRVTQSVIRAHRPQWVIAAGFAVPLKSQLKEQDLLMASRLIDTLGRCLKIDLDESAANTGAFQCGTVLTLDQIPTTESQRRSLGDTHGADAADTTSLGIAEACRDAGVCCLAIRIVRENLEESPPREIQHSSKQNSVSARLGSLVGGTLRRPSTVRDWFQHKQSALNSADHLAEFLKGVICHWLPLRPREESSGSSEASAESTPPPERDR